MKINPAILLAALAGLAVGVAGALTFAPSGGADGASAGPAAGARGPGGGRPGGGRGGYRPVVSMAVVEDASISRRVDVVGRARASKSVAIVSEVTGLVESVSIAPGKRVAEGDVLLQIDDEEAQAALARASAVYPIAKANWERYRGLESAAAASALEAEEAQTRYLSARAELDAAQVAVTQRKIIAPFNGIAGLTDIEAGDYLRAGDPVTTLDDTTAIVVEFAAPQESAAFVDIGQPVTASLTSASAVTFAGEITAIDSRVDPQSRTLRVEAIVDNDNGRLIPGAVLAVSTVSEGEPAVAAPGLAVQWDRSGAFVWRRGEDGAAERTGVVILQRTEDRVLVEGELKAGDFIVAEGADRVRAGSPLPGPPGEGRPSTAGPAARR